MRIALAQTNPVLGDFASNARKIIDFANRAHEKRAQLAVFSEMCLFGYPANDALEYQDVVAAQSKELKKLIRRLPEGMTVIFGAVVENASKKGKPYQNAAVVARRGQKPKIIAKQLLPSYDVFDETRFFEPGQEPGLTQVPGIGKVAVTVCEDMWGDLQEGGRSIYSANPFAKLKKADLVVNISASPFSITHMGQRVKTARAHALKLKVPFVYVNQVGGQDELIFEGRSFILDKKGHMVVQAAACEEDLVIADLSMKRAEYRPPEENDTESLRKALVLGLRDFARKTGHEAVHLGLSGGIDSSLLAALAVDALGPNHVVGFLLPGPYSSEGSVTDAHALAKNLGIKTYTISIKELYEDCRKTFGKFSEDFAKDKPGEFSGHNGVSIMEQNIQARLRGLTMMAFSNVSRSMLLSTVNKSELAAGYGTLYGDLCGGLAPLADLTKEEVYALARYYNAGREIIPLASIEKAPSAELAPGQKDQDTLPPYEVLDKAIKTVVELKKNPRNKTENWLREKIVRSEFKRWQAPPVLRVSDHAFGRGRRMPIAFKFAGKPKRD
jgi:NAD+ synthase (glutamine-hydrolysing)